MYCGMKSEKSNNRCRKDTNTVSSDSCAVFLWLLSDAVINAVSVFLYLIIGFIISLLKIVINGFIALFIKNNSDTRIYSKCLNNFNYCIEG